MATCYRCDAFEAVVYARDYDRFSERVCRLCAHMINVHNASVDETYQCDCSWVEVYGFDEVGRRLRERLPMPVGVAVTAMCHDELIVDLSIRSVTLSACVGETARLEPPRRVQPDPDGV